MKKIDSFSEYKNEYKKKTHKLFYNIDISGSCLVWNIMQRNTKKTLTVTVADIVPTDERF